MSTPCVIVVEGNGNVGIYKHWDGYPEEMIPMLKKFIEIFMKERGYMDESYLLARILIWMGENDKSVTGYGIIDTTKSYYSYKYIIGKDGSIHVIDGE